MKKYRNGTRPLLARSYISLKVLGAISCTLRAISFVLLRNLEVRQRAAKHLLLYLAGTAFFAIVYKKGGSHSHLGLQLGQSPTTVGQFIS